MNTSSLFRIMLQRNQVRTTRVRRTQRGHWTPQVWAAALFSKMIECQAALGFYYEGRISACDFWWFSWGGFLNLTTILFNACIFTHTNAQNKSEWRWTSLHNMLSSPQHISKMRLKLIRSNVKLLIIAPENATRQRMTLFHSVHETWKRQITQ